jgi:hypothetical protein
MTHLFEEEKPFEFDDLRSQRDKATPDSSSQETAFTARLNASVPPGRGVSISEAIGKH